MSRYTPIDRRVVPPVAGIDLEQSLNYVDSEGLDLSWFYMAFTYPRTFYRTGSRLVLEAFLAPFLRQTDTDRQKLEQCLKALSQGVSHYSRLGFAGRGDRGACEEDLLALGQGWCNEQARVLAAFTQIAGLPSRLVFLESATGNGHVITEVYLDQKWIAVDQTAEHVFTRADNFPINVLELRSNPAYWQEAEALYKAALLRDRERAKDKAFWDKTVPYGCIAHPLELFTHVGYCNYFFH